MRLSITVKLFLTMLATCALVLLIHGIAGRISFERGFIGYLNDQGLERMREVLPRLEQEYHEQGNWNRLENNFPLFGQLMRPATHFADGTERAVPPISDQTGALFRLALLQPDYRNVIGNPEADRSSILLPIRQGETLVGWLAMVPFQKAVADGDVRFFNAQLRAWWIIGISAVILAALLAFWLSRALLRHLRAMTAAAARLEDGDYASRIPVTSRDELGMLAQRFNLLAQALERNELTRRHFMADISHELRTPLSVMRSELEAIQDGIRDATPESVAALHQQVHQLGKLVDDLHDLSLTDAGALAYRRVPVDLATIVRSSLVGARPRFEAAGLSLSFSLPDAPLRMLGDERRLQQLLSNLLGNALRYTDAGGQVQLRCARTGQGLLELVIEDSAPGVPADKQARLFERFYRVDASRNRASGGSGLGLAICRNIVQAHGGQIAASDSPLGGLRIRIELPEAV